MDTMTRQRDGDRLLRYWKVLAQLFKSTNHRNYAKDAVNLLYQYHYKMSERQKEQLMWSRCINTRGVPGANIPCDLHMEHLNRRLKTVIRNMGANKSSSSIKTAGKAIGAVYHVCEEFEAQTANQIHSDHHPILSFGDDFSTILYQLTTDQIFVPTSNRQHSSFPYKCFIMEELSRGDLIKKIKKNIKQL